MNHLSSAGWPDWGDIPTWVASVGAILAFIVAVRAFGRERARDEDRNRASRRHQAELVSAWMDRDGAGEWSICIRNGSQLPIYVVRLTVNMDTFSLTRDFKVIPPSGEPLTVNAGESLIRGMNSVLDVRNLQNRLHIQLRFSDAAGRTWTRDHRGVLSEGAQSAEQHRWWPVRVPRVITRRLRRKRSD